MTAVIPFEAVTFNRGLSYRAVVNGVLQKPEFNSKAAALAFAEPVHTGKRKAEPALNQRKDKV